MATGAGYNPGTTAIKWAAEVWAKTYDRGAYENAVLWPRVEEYTALKNKLHIPQHEAVTAVSVAGTSDIYEPTFAAATETEKTISPTFNNVPFSVDVRVLARAMADPRDMLRISAEKSLGVAVDTQVATLFTSLTTNIEGDYASDLDLPKILSARSKVKAGAKEYATDGSFVLAYHHLQDDAVMGIGQFTQFYIRGDKQNPAVGGVVGQAYGIDFISTGNVQNSGGGYNNAMFIKQAFGISFNQRPTIRVQDHGYAVWLLGWCESGAATVRDAYACLLKSKNT